MRAARRGTQRPALKSAGGPGDHIPAELRLRFGRWLKEARLKAGHTQLSFAEHIGLGSANMNAISAIENGRASCPQEWYSAYADALGMPRADFAKVVLRHTDPWLYQAMTGSREAALADEIALMQKGNFSKRQERQNVGDK